MLLRMSDLKPTDKPGYRLFGEAATRLDLQTIKREILSLNEEKYGLPLEIREDKIKSGGLFNSSVEDCLLVINTQYRADYFSYALILKKQGKTATVEMYYWGTSKWTGRANAADRRKQEGGFGGWLMNAAFSVNEKKMQEEYEYYELLEGLFAELFS